MAFELLPRLKGLILKISCPLFYRHIGKNCKFYGRVRLPRFYSNITIGDNCMIGDSVCLECSRHGRVELANNVSINTGSIIVSSMCIIIEDNVAVAEYVTIRDQEHIFKVRNGVRDCSFKTQPTKIKSNSWICRGSYIGPGITIESSCIVGANSVVTKSIPPYSIAVGIPAKVIKKFDFDSQKWISI